MIYAIAHRDGTVACRSGIPYLGYSLPILKDMEQAGYLLLLDGKRTKLPAAAQLREVRHD